MEKSLENTNKKQREVKTKHPLYSYIQKILSPGGRQNEILRLNSILESNESKQIINLQAELNAISLRYASEKIYQYDELRKQEEQIKSKLHVFDPSLVRTIIKTKDKIDSLTQQNRLLIEGNRALSILSRLASNSFNSRHTDRVNLFNEINEPYDRSKIVDLSILGMEQQIEFPIGMFISATGFKNWYGRGSDTKKNEKNSNEVINDYASQDSSTAPPVCDITAHLFSSGEIYVNSGNSHRVAAAILRGDKTIKFNGVMTLILVDEERLLLHPNHYSQKPV